MLEWWGYLLTGVGAAAVIKLVDNIIQWALQRKDKTEDRAEKRSEVDQQTQQERILKMEHNLQVVMEGQRYLLLDRIRELGLEYLSLGEVSFDEKRLLHQMHDVYHDKLCGNGDLEGLMIRVDELPLKK